MAKPLEVLGLEHLEGMDAKSEALLKLNALAENVDEALALRKSNGLLQKAVKAWYMGRTAYAAQMAFEATKVSEDNASAYLVLGIALEKMGYLYKALVTYEKAYQLDPEDPEVVINLGQLANKFNMPDVSEKLCRKYIEKKPEAALGYNNLACVLSGQGRVDEAIEILRQAIYKVPQEALLWNSLATILAEEGRIEESIVFYREAIRLVPGCTRYYHNLAYAYMHLNRVAEAIQLYDDALAHVTDPGERYESRFSRSICLIQIGRLEEGFKEYEVRNNKRFRGFTQYVLRPPAWEGEPLEGKTILAIGEQGLGDEIMFANILPDLVRALGPTGKLQIAVEPRLVDLFARSFPDALVGRYDDRAVLDRDGKQEVRYFPFQATAPQADCYANMGSLLQLFRNRVEDFPHRTFLKPDPDKVASLRARLREKYPTGLLVGICWRSMMLTQKRGKYYSSLDMWGPIFNTVGVHFVNLQYGNCEEELAEAEKLHGIAIERVEGHDLTQDIDGNAALSAALDLVISAPTSVAATAAAVGTETWFLLSSNGWPQMGTQEYPWYPKTRTFAPKGFAQWDDVMARAGAALKTRVDQS
jgi:Flp pilus assembly protein TadD